MKEAVLTLIYSLLICAFMLFLVVQMDKLKRKEEEYKRMKDLFDSLDEHEQKIS